MTQLSFWKYQGAGNDFVFLDGSELQAAGVESKVLKQLALRLCDRHFGIGADGLIVVSSDDAVDAKMQYFNADGMETVCGNGIRCVARFLVDEGKVSSDSSSISLKTFNGVVSIAVLENGKRFEVNMGEPIFDGKKIPVAKSGKHLEQLLDVDEHCVTISAVSMGNPHCIIFLGVGETPSLWPLAAQLEVHKFFPEKTNVEFVEIVDRGNVVVKVWERGVGETLACGTGNCALLAAGVERGYLDREVSIKAAGGDFFARWEEDSNCIFLQGPAEFVFSGKVAIERHYV